MDVKMYDDIDEDDFPIVVEEEDEDCNAD